MPLHRPDREGRPACLALVTLLACAALLPGCRRPPSGELQAGSYRAVLVVPGGRELPFGLDVAREERGPVLYLLNGSERVRVDEVEATTGRLRARVPGYETTLEASVAGGELEGTVTLVHAAGRTLELPFRATLGELWRFERTPRNDNADVSGRWELRFAGAEGPQGRAIAELTQRFHEVSGTVVTAAGEQRLIAGDVHDERLRLSRFDGGVALLYEAKLDARGALVGQAWSDREGWRRFTARRNPDADADAILAMSRLSATETPFGFSLPDLDGRAVTADDPFFRDKALLVAVGGSWDPSTHEQAALLVEMDRRYRERGLAVVGLMVEQHADLTRAAAAVRRFRDAHGIEFPTLIAGHGDPRRVSAALPQIESLGAYPTTLFVDRGGRVRRVLNGFAGPATGVRHERLLPEYVQTVESLLAEPAGTDHSGSDPE